MSAFSRRYLRSPHLGDKFIRFQPGWSREHTAIVTGLEGLLVHVSFNTESEPQALTMSTATYVRLARQTVRNGARFCRTHKAQNQ